MVELENLLSTHSQLVYANMKMKNVSPLFCAPVFLRALMCVRKLHNFRKIWEKNLIVGSHHSNVLYTYYLLFIKYLYICRKWTIMWRIKKQKIENYRRKERGVLSSSSKRREFKINKDDGRHNSSAQNSKRGSLSHVFKSFATLPCL